MLPTTVMKSNTFHESRKKFCTQCAVTYRHVTCHQTKLVLEQLNGSCERRRLKNNVQVQSKTRQLNQHGH